MIPAALNPIGHRIHVPARLNGITSIGAEVSSKEAGLPAIAKPTIWAAAQLLYRTGLHPALSLVIRYRGHVVIDRAIGTRTRQGTELMTTQTPACLYSCSKAISALLIHKLVELGDLSLDAPVALYLPEFAANGKESVTVRDLLSHRAGIAALPLPRNPDPMLLFDRKLMVDLLCAAPQAGTVKQAYHAVTAGFILGEIAERISGQPLPQLLEQWLASPLGLSTLSYGVPPERRDHVALSYSTGPELLPPLTQMVHRLLGVRPHLIAPAFNTPAGMDAIVPAANIYASAHDMGAIFQMLLDGGESHENPVLQTATINEAVRPAGPRVIDGSIPLPLRFSAGFMLGERGPNLFGTRSPKAFGHLGFTNTLGWADPDRDIAVALITTGKAVSPEGVAAMAAVATAITTTIPPRRNSPR